MNELLKNTKTPNQVDKDFTAIILIAILIAAIVLVPMIAVVWMDSPSNEGMQEITVTEVTFSGTTGAANNTIVLAITSTGSRNAIISLVKVNGNLATSSDTPLPVVVGASGSLTITAAGWESGHEYTISMFEADDGLLISFHTAWSPQK